MCMIIIMLMLTITIPYLCLLVKPQSQVTKTAVSITVSIIVLLLIAIVVVLGLLGCVIYFKQRNKDFHFQVKYKRKVDDDDELHTLDAPPENYNFESDNKSELNSADTLHKDPDCSKKPVDSEPHLESVV